jgi:hypothetical protein
MLAKFFWFPEKFAEETTEYNPIEAENCLNGSVMADPAR